MSMTPALSLPGCHRCRGTKGPRSGPKDPGPALVRRSRLDHKARLLEVNVMRSHAKPRLNEDLARLARWLGFDRNPLRRGTDRVEGALRLVMIILAVLAVPAASVAAGRWADHYALHRAQVQRTVDHQVTAVLLRDAPAIGTSDPYASAQTAWVPARWQQPGQPPRTGEVLAVAGARKGSTVRTWIDPSGMVTGPPVDHRVIVGNVLLV